MGIVEWVVMIFLAVCLLYSIDRALCFEKKYEALKKEIEEVERRLIIECSSKSSIE